MMYRTSADLATDEYDILETLGRARHWKYRNSFEYFDFNNEYSGQLRVSTEVSVHKLKNILFRLVEWLPSNFDTLIWIENFSLSSPSCLMGMMNSFEQRKTDDRIAEDNVFVVGRISDEAKHGSADAESDRRMDILLGTLISCIADDLDFKVICPGSSDHLYFSERKLFAASLDPKRRHECSLSFLDDATSKPWQRDG